MRKWPAIATAATLTIQFAALIDLAGAGEMFQPVLHAGDDESCKTSGAAAGCSRFEGYIYVSPLRSDGTSRDGFDFAPSSAKSTSTREGKSGYLLGSAKP